MRAEPITLDLADATLGLLQATHRARGAAARRFVLLDRSREVWPYHAAVLVRPGGIEAHSGVSEVDANGPYARWVRRLAAVLQARPAGPVGAADLADSADDRLGEAWSANWPAHALWMPSPVAADDAASDAIGGAGLVVVRDLPWTARESAAFQRWWGLWWQADRLATRSEAADRRRALPARLAAAARGRVGRIALAASVAVAAIGAVPVPLTVRAPGEIVPRSPVVVRVPVEGQVRRLAVEPNQAVRAGDLLAELDDGLWRSRQAVARQALATADAEWRQVHQLALSDPRAKAQLAAVQGRVLERQAELAFVEAQLQRTQVTAPADGVVLVQDPGGWAGRMVAAGEPLLRLAGPDDRELEAWVAVGDAIDLPPQSRMTFHGAASPGAPVPARLRHMAYEAETRPDLGLGYRVRGSLDPQAPGRLGARGTVHIDGASTPLALWVLRRPLAALRESTGW